MSAASPLLHDWFATSAARFADRIAIEVPPGPGRPQRRQLSYAELAQAAASLRARLQPHVRGECVVAVLLPRGVELFAAQLAILGAGAAHTCLEASLPDEHIAFVLRDCKAAALLTDAAGAQRARQWLPADRIVDVGAAAAAGPAPPTPAWLGPRSLAYVIYTSGTTGWPKGVLIEHHSISNLVAADVETFGLGPDDRVAQGSSPAYDSSVEETWLAWAAGAALVVMDHDAARLGPDLVPWLRQQRITVLCPPPTLLRATSCLHPGRELPDLRLCYVGGEALPQDLADRWAGDLWLENGYGPTECTVTVVRGRVHRGAPVGIGLPVRGHRAFVLDDQLGDVAAGTAGELCIAGPGLARGYLDRDELTRQKFVEHPRHGRIYRTGDLVRQAADGELFYLGRIDAQVKLRGHRVELEAVESLLAQCPGVRAAACRVQGEGSAQLLAGFVVPVDAAAPPPWPQLAAALARSLPAHMLPQRYALLPALPLTVGGKLDRRALPELPAAAAADLRPPTPPRDALENDIAAAFARALGGIAVGIDDDFFALGGNSLRAAELVSALRSAAATAVLAVRDVYQQRTVAALAALAQSRGPAQLQTAAAAPRRGSPLLVTAAQTAFLLLELLAGTALVAVVFTVLVPSLLARVGLLGGVLLLPLLAFAARLAGAGVALALAVAAKRLLIGRYREGRTPVWSWTYLRHWLVQRLVRMVPWAALQGTVLHNAALRALGARIGRRVHIHRGVDLLHGGWDLLQLGDDVTLAQDADLGLVELHDGHVVVAPIGLGPGSTLEVRAGMRGGSSLGPRAVLTPLSSLPRGSRVPADQCWDGVPAAPAGAAPAVPATNGEAELSEGRHALAMLLGRLRLTVVLSLPFAALALALVALTGVDTEAFLALWTAPWSHPLGVALLAALAVGSVPATLLASALWLRATPVRRGCCSRWSRTYVRIWLRTGVVEAASRWLSGTLFWPHWLRLAGARIGTDCEISTVVDVLPEHLQLAFASFLADGIYLGGPRLYRGTATVAPTCLGRNTFLGNHVVVPPASQLPPDVLLGVCTVADAARISPGSDWFGHPPFRLPRREVVHCDPHLLHSPSPLRYTTRLFWETLRLLLPIAPVLLGAAWLQAVCRLEATAGTALLLAAVPLATLLTAAAPVLLVLLLKWLLLGRVRPGLHPLWSCWCSRWDFLYVAWGMFARPLLSQLEGTLLLAVCLRGFGMRIGRRVVLGAGFAQVVDPDMLQFDDGATVDGMFQAHSFEDRVLKIDRVHIRAGASVGRAAVLMYGADIGERASVAPHSVVMKHERLLPGQDYDGVPTQPR